MKTYVTPNFSDVTQDMIDDCIQTTFDILRHNVTGTDKVVMEYLGSDPTWVSTLSLTKFTHSGIKTEMAKDEWQAEDD